MDRKWMSMEYNYLKRAGNISNRRISRQLPEKNEWHITNLEFQAHEKDINNIWEGPIAYYTFAQ